eukprot:CAMPEP_0205905172 /NCGR_PEP_ID=MMETSP1325-20131115/1188_1 /ASSEMBLY_ACC=CAM_ASM_000708 /TAXON_ID=236786 /ORGANISM="Florenciella sp., Strain RCC1007" /LENGTH=221 /DNA_ID=CAMNT_0053271055 /DNA_START=21 /DNA_END=686 /DNA_ORIENTATION=+
MAMKDVPDEYAKMVDPATFEVEAQMVDGLTPNQRARIVEARAAPSMPWKHLIALYVLSGSAFITAVVAASRQYIFVENSMSAADIASACPYGDLTYGDDIYSFDGHHYQVVGSKDAVTNWRQAAQDANSRCYNGERGYLVNIDSQDENDFLYAKLMLRPGFQANVHDAWIGATDMSNEGAVSWIGPKHLVNGVKFWEGGPNGKAVDGRYKCVHACVKLCTL